MVTNVNKENLQNLFTSYIIFLNILIAPLVGEAINLKFQFIIPTD